MHYKQAVTAVKLEKGQPVAVETKRRKSFPADGVIFNLPPWNIAELLGDDAPVKLRRLPARPKDGWGAFTVHVGVDGSLVPPEFPLHHQMIVREPLAEGNTVFLSLSPAWDAGRGPMGCRAVTLSAHTRWADWWALLEADHAAYQHRKQQYAERLLTAAETALPGLRAAANLILPGTPVTFQRFTRRAWGWVGGFPQTSLFRAWPPQLSPRMWMVGDSIFPGQSTAAVALGGLRVAQAVLKRVGR